MAEGSPTFESMSFIEAEERGTEYLAEWVEARWESFQESWVEFREVQAEDAENPIAFIESTIESWTVRHQESEYVDVESALDRSLYLLALLVETGAEWPADKRNAVRQFLLGFICDEEVLAKISLENFKVWNILKTTVLTDGVSEGIHLTQQEQELLRQWKQETNVTLSEQ